ncbi:MAG: c-type cytochrome [Nautiliaceae bacterium]
MLIRLLIILITSLYAKEESWFITKLEYGKMLYHNPRGISCAKCHGEKAQGKIITSYINSKNEKVIIKTTPFKNLTFEKLKKALFHQIKIKPLLKKDPKNPIRFINIMPKYDYLTDNEIQALLLYINSKEKK